MAATESDPTLTDNVLPEHDGQERQDAHDSGATAAATPMAVAAGAESISSSEQHALVGAVIGDKYAIEGVVHRGRRTDVFVATQTMGLTSRQVALKIPHDLSIESAEILAREAGVLSVIDHPNVVNMRDVGTDDRCAFLALEPLVGETLAERIEAEGPLSAHEALAVFWQVLAGLRAVHEAGVVHRDLRPRNVFIEARDDKAPLVWIIDFATARFVRPDHPDAKVEPPYPVGAHNYMAPEQHRGEESGPWVDIFATGVMLYAALANELPTPGVKLSERAGTPLELDDVIAKATAEDPAARYESALAFQDALTRALLVG